MEYLYTPGISALKESVNRLKRKLWLGLEHVDVPTVLSLLLL